MIDERFLMIAAARSREGVERFDLNEEKESDVYKWVLTLDEYKQLSSFGVFALLNEYCGCIIGDYEDDSICGKERLLKGLTIIGELLNSEVGTKNFELVERLAGFFVLAYSRNTCVYFYF